MEFNATITFTNMQVYSGLWAWLLNGFSTPNSLQIVQERILKKLRSPCIRVREDTVLPITDKTQEVTLTFLCTPPTRIVAVLSIRIFRITENICGAICLLTSRCWAVATKTTAECAASSRCGRRATAALS